MDTLNALLLTRREHAALIAHRRIVIDVLDMDTEGPAFGARALEAWRQEGGPLAGLDIRCEHVRYDWRRVETLSTILARARANPSEAASKPTPWFLASSEGGLFGYGSDDEIVANLEALRAGTPPDFAMAGSVTRADAPIQRLRETSRAATRPRGMDVFRKLVARAGFTVARVIERPFSDQVLLRPDST